MATPESSLAERLAQIEQELDALGASDDDIEAGLAYAQSAVAEGLAELEAEIAALEPAALPISYEAASRAEPLDVGPSETEGPGGEAQPRPPSREPPPPPTHTIGGPPSPYDQDHKPSGLVEVPDALLRGPNLPAVLALGPMEGENADEPSTAEEEEPLLRIPEPVVDEALEADFEALLATRSKSRHQAFEDEPDTGLSADDLFGDRRLIDDVPSGDTPLVDVDASEQRPRSHPPSRPPSDFAELLEQPIDPTEFDARGSRPPSRPPIAIEGANKRAASSRPPAPSQAEIDSQLDQLLSEPPGGIEVLVDEMEVSEVPTQPPGLRNAPTQPPKPAAPPAPEPEPARTGKGGLFRKIFGR